jgi:acyl carrier protein
MSQERLAMRDPAFDALCSQLRELIVSELQLPGKTADDLADEQPLFGEGGLGLDSLDALQIAMAIEERHGVRVPEGAEARPVFASVSSLAAFVLQARAERPTP